MFCVLISAMIKASIAKPAQMIFKFSRALYSFFVCLNADMPPIANNAAAKSLPSNGSAAILKMERTFSGCKNKGIAMM